MSRTILIVEDKKEEQEKAKKIYEDAGFKVIVAGSYEEFQTMARQFNCFTDRTLGGRRLYNDEHDNFPKDKKTGEWVDCIITDLTFPMDSSADSEVGDFGYSIIARAAKIGLACFICTDSKHHGPSGKKGLIEEIIRITGSSGLYSSKKQWDFFLDFI